MPKTKNIQKVNTGQIVIYKPRGGGVELKVKLEEETIWLDAHQMGRVFDIDRTVIVKHIRNIYASRELSEKSTCAKIAQVAADGRIREMNFYNLDMIISVGYRVNSKRATQFRIWGTKVLKNYLFKGYAIDEKRLLEAREKFNQLQKTIVFLRKKSQGELLKGQEKEILDLLADYAKTLTLLERYDKNKLKGLKKGKSKFKLEYVDCKIIIGRLREELIKKKEASDIFGHEAYSKFEGIVKNLYQTFGRKELYKSLEQKAAHLLYLTIKDHPFTDGNKRIGSFLFVYFLDKNNYLYQKSGEKKINDNALTALALLIAESESKGKELMIALITQLLE